MNKIHLAFEASLIAKGSKTGLGQYALNLLVELMKREDLKITLIHSSKEWEGPDFGLPTESYYFWKESLAIYFRLNSILKRIGADVFHAPGNTGIPSRVAIPAVVTVHDIFPLLSPDQVAPRFYKAFKHLHKWVMKGASRLLIDSQMTSKAIQSYYSCTDEKFEVVHLGPCNQFTWEGGGDYFLCVGAIEPRKGQLFLARRYLEALECNSEIEDLIFIGTDRGDAAELQGLIEQSKGKIKWLNYVSDEELCERYKKCKALYIPSSYEGFGLSVLEGVLAGAPVICSGIEVLREVGWDYPLYLNLDDSQQWCNSFLNNTAVPAKADDDYIKHFSWKNYTAKAVELYKRVIEDSQ